MSLNVQLSQIAIDRLRQARFVLQDQSRRYRQDGRGGLAHDKTVELIGFDLALEVLGVHPAVVTEEGDALKGKD